MTLSDWLATKREEARKMHLAEYRKWIDAGCVPAAMHWR